MIHRQGENKSGKREGLKRIRGMAMAVELGSSRLVKYSATQLDTTGLQRLNGRIVSMPVRSRSNRCYRSISAGVADPSPSLPPSASSPLPPSAPTEPASPPPRPTFSMKKGQIVRVDKEKYLDSVEYYAVAHPKYFKGLDYIYEDRGEVLDIRMFEAGEYALISWAGISTSPAWLPTYMLIKADKLSYRRT